MEKMPEIIVAVYENGMLRPQVPVSLSEGQTVRLRVVPEVSPGGPKTELDKAFQLMLDQGWMTLPPHDPNIKPVTDEEVHELAKRLGAKPGKPLSEIIIEDRR